MVVLVLGYSVGCAHVRFMVLPNTNMVEWSLPFLSNWNGIHGASYLLHTLLYSRLGTIQFHKIKLFTMEFHNF